MIALLKSHYGINVYIDRMRDSGNRESLQQLNSSDSTSNLTPSAPVYIPPQRRGKTAPISSPSTRLASRFPTHRGQPFLTLEDLHTRYSPPDSPPLRMPRVQRSLSAEDLHQQFQSRQQVPLPPRDLDALRNRYRPPSPRSQPNRLSPKLPTHPFSLEIGLDSKTGGLGVRTSLLLIRTTFQRKYFVLSTLYPGWEGRLMSIHFVGAETLQKILILRPTTSWINSVIHTKRH